MTRFRRNHPRIPAPPVVALLPQGRDRAEVKLRDLSLSGAALLTRTTVPVGALLDIELRPAEGRDVMPCPVRARVARKLDPPEPGIAVEFVEQRWGDTFRLFQFFDRHVRVLTRGPTNVPERAVGAASASATGRIDPAVLEAELAQAKQRSFALAQRVRELEDELDIARRDLAAARRALAAERRERPPRPPAEPSAFAQESRASVPEPLEVTLGPDSVRTLDDFAARLERGARLRRTERFATLQPVTRADIQLAEWLRSAERLEDLEAATKQLGGADRMAAALYRFFERGLIRITR